MKKRYQNDSVGNAKIDVKEGPVVTISRDYGCPAKQIARELSSALNRTEAEYYSNEHWRWISKEILDKSAQELNLKRDLVREVINNEQDGIVDDIILSLSHREYPGDIKIKRTIRDVIRSFAEHGHVIIVGRGGVSITRDIQYSLHVRIQAPLEWRINQVGKEQMMSLSDARKKIIHVDTQRSQLRKYYDRHNRGGDNFDVVFNYLTLDEEDIVSSIVSIMESRDMI